MINSKAYTEVNEIIQSMPKEMQEKIPEVLRKTIEYNCDKNYEFQIDNLNEIDLLEDTEKILSVLYTDYFATEEERKIILSKEKSIEYNNNLKKQTQYPSDFIKKEDSEIMKEKIVQENSLDIKKDKLYVRIFQRIKEMFGLV